MNPFSWPAEGWYFWLSFLAVIFVGASVITSLGALYASRVVNRRQTSQLVTLATDLAGAKTRQAEAELALKKRVDKVQKLAGPRTLPADEFRDAVAKLPKTSIGFLYKKDSDEAYQFAMQLWATFNDMGWDAAYPFPKEENKKAPPTPFPSIPSGVTICWKMKEIPPTPKSDPTGIGLFNTFITTGFEASFRGLVHPPTQEIIILVGAKQ
jgi:hypothetical protein